MNQKFNPRYIPDVPFSEYVRNILITAGVFGILTGACYLADNYSQGSKPVSSTRPEIVKSEAVQDRSYHRLYLSTNYFNNLESRTNNAPTNSVNPQSLIL